MNERLSQILKSQNRKPLNLKLEKTPVESAVMVLCMAHPVEPHIVLTKRSEEVEHHKGQICFPGGVKDASDNTLWQTALRETYEEIGLPPQKVHYVGELSQVVTPTNFIIHPFVGWIDEAYEWNTNPTEIAQIFTVPVSHVLNPQNFVLEKRNYFGSEYHDPVFTYGEHRIWGATGRILVDLLEAWKSL
ncbi:CoA pyrophosphatase [bacterium]|nr:CoA pyrophosphatase [bacterium]